MDHTLLTARPISYDWRFVQQTSTVPTDSMFCGMPPMFLNPSQSRYHNLGLNAFTSCGQVYAMKRPGMLGDWGPVQQGYRTRARNDVYPLDYPTDFIPR